MLSVDSDVPHASRFMREHGPNATRAPGRLKIRLGAITASCAFALLVTGCQATASPGADGAADADSTATADEDAESGIAEDGAQLDADDIAAWIAETEWSFADRGIGESETLQLQEGGATDDLGRTYEVGNHVEGDANGDGVVDLAVPIAQADGNGFVELWYVWLGIDGVDPAAGDSVAEQLHYPIARTVRCGDAVHAVTAIDGGFQVEQTLWHPSNDANRDCASGGTGDQVRDITVTEVDGEPFPIQTAPIPAWGGVCPLSEWQDGILESDSVGLTAPSEAAPTAFEQGETVSLYQVPDSPLMTADGFSFFGFQTEALSFDDQADADATPVRMHCAFAMPTSS